MMNHTSYRRALLSDPRSDDAEMRRHRDTCSQCAAYADRLLQFESRLQRALRVKMRSPAAPGLGARRLALAASLLLVLLVGGAAWLAVPRTSLAAAVVEHMAGEPAAWSTRTAVPDPALESALKDAHMHLGAGAGVVSYARSCEFRGHPVPHLVVQSARGPVTVMVLAHESVRTQVRFDEQGYRGIIVPMAGRGSMAVLMRAPDAQIDDIESMAARVAQAIVWVR